MFVKALKMLVKTPSNIFQLTYVTNSSSFLICLSISSELINLFIIKILEGKFGNYPSSISTYWITLKASFLITPFVIFFLISCTIVNMAMFVFPAPVGAETSKFSLVL